MIRNGETKDLPNILEIYGHARQFMRENNNPTQWSDGYPPESLLKKFLIRQQLYVVTDEKCVHGVFTFAIGEDETYAVIREGAWLSDTPYGTVHLVAGDGKVHGILREITVYCWQKIPHLRMDTHKDNLIMQHLLVQNGFQKCGLITAGDGTPRLAYEKLV